MAVPVEPAAPPRMAIPRGRTLLVGVDDAHHGVALDELPLSPPGVAQGGLGEAVEVAQAVGCLVQHRERVFGEDVTIAADESEAVSQVVCGIVGARRVEVQAVLNPRVERPLMTARQALFQLGQTDEEERQERATVPLI